MISTQHDRGLRFLFSAALSAMTACGPGNISMDGGTAKSPPPVQLISTPMSSEEAARVDAAVRKLYDTETRKEIPGLWIGIWDVKRGFFLAAYGESERGKTAAAIQQTFRIGSVSKTFTATAVLRLIDQGKLGLDDPVGTVHPDLAKQYSALTAITIRQLLGMSSGIPDYLNIPKSPIIATLTNAPTHEFTTDELIRAGLSAGIMSGTPQPEYSNTNYIVLERIIEKVSGKSFPEAISSMVIGPLGLSRTAFPDPRDASLPSPASHGYLNTVCSAELAALGGSTLQNDLDTSNWNVTSSRAAGAAYSTLSDLGLWAATTSGSVLLSSKLQNERLRTVPISAGTLNYGLGIFRLGRWLGHSGQVFGWEAYALHDPERGVTFVLGTNSCSGATTLAISLLESLYPA